MQVKKEGGSIRVTLPSEIVGKYTMDLNHNDWIEFDYNPKKDNTLIKKVK